MDNTPETLVILSPGFPKNEADTACIPPQQVFVKALKQANPQLNIIVLAFDYPFFSAEYNWHGVKVISFGNKTNNRFLNFFTHAKANRVLKKLNGQYRIIGLLSFWIGKCALVGNSFAKQHNLLHYCWLLGQDAKAGNKYVNKIDPQANSLIALSDFIWREFYKNYGVLPRHVIPVGVDTGLFKTGTFERDIDILGAGSLIPLKQFAVFLEIINTLKITHSNIKAVICGKGPEMQRLQGMIKSWGMESNITLTGELPHEQVLAIMQRSKIFLHTSEYEGFGAVCPEALYAGAKVVSFVKPMDAKIPNWYIANDKDNALEIINILLTEPQTYQKVLPYPIEDNVAAMLRLFK